MTQEFESSPLTFSLEEAVMFRKGEEIAELYNLALEPDISVYDLGQFVLLRGRLEVIGEYKKKDWEGEEELSFSGQKYVSVSSLEKDDLYQFTYHFPVDITIPNSRVQNIEELDLVIDSFDYALEDEDTLVISTEISVVGVYDEELVEHEESEDRVEGKAEEPFSIPYQEMIVPFPDFDPDEDGNESFAREEELEEEKQGDEIEELTIEMVEEDSPVRSNQDGHEENTKEALSPDPHQSEGDLVANRDEAAPVAQPFPENEVVTFSDSKHDHVEEEQENQEEIVTVEAETLGEDEDEDTDFSPRRMEKQITYQPHEDAEKEDKKDLLLTDFFSEKEERRMTTLRLYFVQSGDTIDGIAERYKINISSILRVNDLQGNEDLKEGELLYIPKSKVKEK